RELTSVFLEIHGLPLLAEPVVLELSFTLPRRVELVHLAAPAQEPRHGEQPGKQCGQDDDFWGRRPDAGILGVKRLKVFGQLAEINRGQLHARQCWLLHDQLFAPALPLPVSSLGLAIMTVIWNVNSALPAPEFVARISIGTACSSSGDSSS